MRRSMRESACSCCAVLEKSGRYDYKPGKTPDILAPRWFGKMFPDGMPYHTQSVHYYNDAEYYRDKIENFDQVLFLSSLGGAGR